MVVVDISINTNIVTTRVDKMFNKISKFFKNLFDANTYSKGLERFIASKGVQSAAEVDYWVRQYEKKGVAPWF